MLHRPYVEQITEEMGFEEAAQWVRENRDLYARGEFWES